MQPVCRFTNWFREHDTEVLSFVPITPGPVTLLSCPATDVNDRRAASRGGSSVGWGKPTTTDLRTRHRRGLHWQYSESVKGMTSCIKDRDPGVISAGALIPVPLGCHPPRARDLAADHHGGVQRTRSPVVANSVRRPGQPPLRPSPRAARHWGSLPHLGFFTITIL